MKAVSLVLMLGCATSSHVVQETEPTPAATPDEFVLRDVRRDAAQRSGCQAPAIELELGPWAGSEGNVMAYGCGFQLTYYLRCTTNHQCLVSRSD